MALFILENFKKSKEQTSYDIIAAAAKIIKSDIREMTCNKSQYPSLKDMGSIVHAWSGCNSTSVILGKEKPSFLNLVRMSPDIQFASEIMSDFWAARNEVGEAAIQIFIKLYGGKKNCSLQKIRLVSLHLNTYIT